MIMNLQLLEKEINSIQTSITEQQNGDNKRRNKFILKAESLEEIFTETQRLHDQEKHDQALHAQELIDASTTTENQTKSWYAFWR